jgi:hypothetical protein
MVASQRQLLRQMGGGEPCGRISDVRRCSCNPLQYMGLHRRAGIRPSVHNGQFETMPSYRAKECETAPCRGQASITVWLTKTVKVSSRKTAKTARLRDSIGNVGWMSGNDNHVCPGGGGLWEFAVGPAELNLRENRGERRVRDPHCCNRHGLPTPWGD